MVTKWCSSVSLLLVSLSLCRSDPSDSPFFSTPANLTVSAGTSVYLPCQIRVKALNCQWMYADADDPKNKQESSSFSPVSKAQNRRGRQGNDCSLQLQDVGSHHTGFWQCAVLPLGGSREYLIAEPPAFLKVNERPGSNERTTTSTKKPKTKEAPPDIVFDPPSAHFIVDFATNGSVVNLTWIVLNDEMAIEHCAWVSPQRITYTNNENPSSSGVEVWRLRGNVCGISFPKSSYGKWSVLAETSRGKLLSAQFDLKSQTTAITADASEDIHTFMMFWIGLSILLVLFVVLFLVFCFFNLRKRTGDAKSATESSHSASSSTQSFVTGGGNQIQSFVRPPPKEDPPKMLPLPPPPLHQQPGSLSRQRHSIVGAEDPRRFVDDPYRQRLVPYAQLAPVYEKERQRRRIERARSFQNQSGFSYYLTMRHNHALHMQDAASPQKRMERIEQMAKLHQIREHRSRSKSGSTDHLYEEIRKPAPKYENSNSSDPDWFDFGSLNRRFSNGSKKSLDSGVVIATSTLQKKIAGPKLKRSQSMMYDPAGYIMPK